MSAPASILIVEDEPIIAADLIDRLEDLGYRVIACEVSGEAALSRLSDGLPDLVLLDVNLAGKLDGVDTALGIRDEYGDVPLIFLTSNSDDTTYRRAREARPSAFLSKPFRGRDLLHAVDLALASYSRDTAVPASPARAGAEELPEGESAMILQDRLFLKVKDRLTRIMVSDILWVQADDYYCRVFTEERDYLVTKPLKRFAEQLPTKGPFLRCHRSYVVNLERVTEIGEIHLFVGKRKLPVSRKRRAELLARVGNL